MDEWEDAIPLSGLFVTDENVWGRVRDAHCSARQLIRFRNSDFQVYVCKSPRCASAAFATKMEKRYSNQTNYAALGSFQGKESCEALANIIVPHLDEGIGKMNDLYCVIFEKKDGTGSDFVMVPRTLCGDNHDVSKSCGIFWSNISQLLRQECYTQASPARSACTHGASPA